MTEGFKHPRRHARTPFSILVQYRFDPTRDFQTEYTTDLSPGGVFLHTDATAAIGTDLYLQFSSRDGSVLIEGVGRVARVIPPGTPGLRAGMGIEFVGMDDATREQIRTMCESPGPRPKRP